MRHRLLLVLSVSALSGAILIAAAATALIRSAVRERMLERVHAEVALLAGLLEGASETDPQRFAEHAARRLGLRVTLIDAEGVVLGDSALDAADVPGMENHAGRPEVAAARLRGTGQSHRRSTTTNLSMFYIARIVPGDGPVRYARAALPAREVDRIQLRYTLLMAGMLPVALLLLSGIGYAAVRRLSRPIESMAHAVEQSIGGGRPLRVPAAGGQELEQLGNAVRTMQEALVSRLDELGGERALLASVIDGMREGLLLVAADRRVRLANAPLRRTLDLAFDPAGHPLPEVVRHPGVSGDIEAALEGGTELRESILRLPSGRAFQVRVAPLAVAGDPRTRAVIVLFFDITQLERLEGVRREFVANVSHELRTPLTSIKAFVETLLDGGLDDAAHAEKFLGIIRKHADRMGELIEDLTDLSLIETGAISLQLDEVDAAEVVAGVIEHLQPQAERREVAVISDVPAPFPIRADRRRLEQMLTNLVDNAIKFSSPGCRVHVRGRQDAADVVLSVEDEGIGIPAESLEKVFHRFYQESRDESADVRGTGLGLSIVKHLMRLHGGRVRVESELGRGSTFRLEFPRASVSAA